MEKRFKNAAGAAIAAFLTVFVLGGQLNTEDVWASEQEPLRAAFEADISNDLEGAEISVDDIIGDRSETANIDPAEETVITGAGDRSAQLFLGTDSSENAGMTDLLDSLIALDKAEELAENTASSDDTGSEQPDEQKSETVSTTEGEKSKEASTDEETEVGTKAGAEAGTEQKEKEADGTKTTVPKEEEELPFTGSYGSMIPGSFSTTLDEFNMSYTFEDIGTEKPAGNVNEEHDANFSKIKWTKNYKKSDLRLLAAIIYCEANEMGHDAMVGVANVVLNRLTTGNWSHCTTIKEVIYDKKWGVQFTPTQGNPSPMSKALDLYDSMDPDVYRSWQINSMNRAIEAAKDALRGYKAVPDSFEYFNSHIDATISKCRENGWSFMIIEKHIYYGHEKLE